MHPAVESRPRCGRSRPVRWIAGGLVVASTCMLVSIANEPSAVAATNIAGMVVYLDPGHNGGNDASISRQVPNGRGGTKDCETAGTSTNAGYPEHSFNWDVVLLVRDALTQKGVRAELSRDNDNALGPCIDQRAA